MINLFIWGCIGIVLSGLFCYHIGYDGGKADEAERWFKKCDKCEKDGSYNID